MLSFTLSECYFLIYFSYVSKVSHISRFAYLRAFWFFYECTNLLITSVKFDEIPIICKHRQFPSHVHLYLEAWNLCDFNIVTHLVRPSFLLYLENSRYLEGTPSSGSNLSTKWNARLACVQFYRTVYRLVKFFAIRSPAKNSPRVSRERARKGGNVSAIKARH